MPSDFANDHVEVWPENWATVEFFASVPIGAWSLGPSGVPFGLRPEALREVRESMGIDLDQWRGMYRDIQVMEDEAFKTMRRESLNNQRGAQRG